MRVILSVMLLFVVVLAQAEVYRWVDDNGNVHVSDTPREAAGSRRVDVREINTAESVKSSRPIVTPLPPTRSTSCCTAPAGAITVIVFAPISATTTSRSRSSTSMTAARDGKTWGSPALSVGRARV